MELRVHLKVCEGCGCLWYRAQVDTGVYCSPCHERFKEFPTPQSRKRRGRPRKTVLSTVFAVEAPMELQRLEGEWLARENSNAGRSTDRRLHHGGYGRGGYGLQPVHQRHPENRALAPEGLLQNLTKSSSNAAGAQ